ncbi:GxxExxY protein [Ereboglobus sp. PH5-10]|uniref:GxxExxY protein n=1 Tax=Ereboglobus sp. PH5-10 TaxID=2940629 RepID=UPI002406A01D|nr:GxxExxY protein [Ereboglobus sp. PH5-10]MDF9828157.1 GxxExxY protein [Ereboglobus sp. PH5-10]
MNLIEQDLSDRVLNAAIEVHRALGPGFLEKIYETALTHELTKRGHKVERQKTVTIVYDGQILGEHRLDLIIDGRIILELKACKAIEDIHLATARSYLKATGCKLALVLNFAEARLAIKRVVLDSEPSALPRFRD